MLLLFPPGWSLNYGSPYLSLPLIKGYLETKNIPCDIIDLNIEAALYHGISYSQEDIVRENQEYNASKNWDFYLDVSKRLAKVASNFDGVWDIRNGFVFNGCNLASSQDILKFSKKKSPFTEFYKRRVLDYVNKHKPKVIGLGAVIPSQLLSSFEIIRILRGNGYKGKIILAGNTTTRLKDAIANINGVFELIDGIIFYQGEHALAAYYNALLKEDDFSEVPNLIWKKGDQVIQNKEKKVPLTDLAMANFDGYPIGKYFGINYLPIIGTRGCYYGRCKFCTIPFAWGKNGFAGFDNPKKVFNHMLKAKKKWGINRFSFVEETLSPVKLKEIAKLIIESKEDFVFEGYARFETSWLREGLVEYLAKAGLKKLFLGLEMISSKSRDVLNKGASKRPVIDYLKLFKKHGVKVHVFILNGYPGTSVQDSINTIKFLLENKQYIDTVDVSYFVWDLHTTHEGVKKIVKSKEDLALSFEYDSLGDNLDVNQARELAIAVESVIMNKNPKWVDPLYRVFSPWADSIKKGIYH